MWIGYSTGSATPLTKATSLTGFKADAKWLANRVAVVSIPKQPITYGTTAWRISMGRRQVVESVNTALKGVFADLDRRFMRVMASRR